MSDDTSTVWIRSEIAADGAYIVSLECGDRVAPLAPDAAMRHASQVLAAATTAEYDAAVFLQMHKRLAVTVRDAAGLLQDLRSDRPPLVFDAQPFLRLEPGVSSTTHKAFLSVFLDDRRVGQWTVPDAEGHAVAVLNAIAVADLDAGYRRLLIGVIGIDEGRAHAAVEDVESFREQVR